MEINERKAEPEKFEHFRFKDGISLPGNKGVREAKLEALETGEFVLGYSDHQGELPESPTVAAADDPLHFLSKSQQLGAQGRKELCKNGSYLVFRKLYQDVGFFNSAMERNQKRFRMR